VSAPKSISAGLIVGAIGVVYGDIGTSVLYAVKEVFGHGHVPFTVQNVYGILSMFFWTLTVIVSIKYVVLVLRADNEGEGGLVAMLALASRAVADKPRLRHVLLVIGIFGTSLFYGDGVITPAISVLSAVEGLEVVSPHFKHYVIPITLVVLFCLFAVQKRGTAGIGKFFGPVTLAWFAAIAVLGVWQILHHPEIVKALNPWYALKFIWDNPGTSFILLGAMVLCVTGAEALYADLGHFGKKPIRIAWFSVVMPALTLNYLGQGALLLENPEAVKNPFFMMAPEWALVPLVMLATLSTVIASQALITGAFSVTRQVIQLGYLPRLNIEHTSVRTAGQIYIPLVNWGLFVAIVLGGGDVPHLEQPGRGLRHRGDHRHADHHDPHLLRDPLCVEAAAGAVHRIDCGLLRGRLPVLRLEPAQAVRRRLVPAVDRRLRVHADDHVEGRPAPHGRGAARGRDRPQIVSRFRVREPAGARGRHGRVPHRGAGRRAQRAPCTT
jgi:KUP system potassium uptake protein